MIRLFTLCAILSLNGCTTEAKRSLKGCEVFANLCVNCLLTCGEKDIRIDEKSKLTEEVEQ